VNAKSYGIEEFKHIFSKKGIKENIVNVVYENTIFERGSLGKWKVDSR
jgi:hypothetical protein